jgi:ketohexokinase
VRLSHSMLQPVDGPISKHPKYPRPDVIDTVGAGDTFIAGMLYCLACRPEFPLDRQLGFAVEIATRKVSQDGFGGLGQAMTHAL